MDNIRSATPEALAFVKSMTDERSAFAVRHFSHSDPRMQSNSHIAFNRTCSKETGVRSSRPLTQTHDFSVNKFHL